MYASYKRKENNYHGRTFLHRFYLQDTVVPCQVNGKVCTVNLFLLLFLLLLVRYPGSIHIESYFYCQIILVYLLESCTMIPKNYIFISYEFIQNNTKCKNREMKNFFFYFLPNIFCSRE